MSKTAVSALQECLAKKNKPMPVYTEIPLEFDLTPCFKVRCSCEGFNADGEASNKKTAKHRAAGKMMKLLQSKGYRFDYSPSDSPPPPEDSFNTSVIYSSHESSPGSPSIFINHVGKLNELCASKKMRQPIYNEIPSKIVRPLHQPEFTIECRIGSVSVSRTSSTKKQAKQDSAEAMRQLLRENYDISNVFEDSQISSREIAEVDELDLGIDNLMIKEAPGLATATARAREMYPGLKKSIGAVTYDPKKVTIGNFHKMFKASFNSETLKRFHEYWASSAPKKTSPRGDLKIILERICEILNLTNEEYAFKTKHDNNYAIGYKFNSKPEIMEVGLGQSYEMALVEALFRSITTIHQFLI